MSFLISEILLERFGEPIGDVYAGPGVADERALAQEKNRVPAQDFARKIPRGTKIFSDKAKKVLSWAEDLEQPRRG